MQFTTITTSLLSIFVLGALANPVPGPNPITSPDMNSSWERDQGHNDLSSRAPAQLIDLWGDANFLGLKYTGTAERGACVNLPSNFATIITSGKARSGLKCTTWEKTGCSGTGFSFVSSARFDSWIDNRSKSWKCVAL